MYGQTLFDHSVKDVFANIDEEQIMDTGSSSAVIAGSNASVPMIDLDGDDANNDTKIVLD